MQVSRGTRIDIFMLPGKLPKSADEYTKKLLLKYQQEKSQVQRHVSRNGKRSIHNRQVR